MYAGTISVIFNVIDLIITWMLYYTLVYIFHHSELDEKP